MRIAHIIITHKNPKQIERLIKRMHHPDFDFYIHLDKKIDIKAFEYLGELKRVNFIKNRIICNWGGYSTLQAMTNSLQEVMNSNIDYKFYNLLSGQDYPIKSNQYIHDYFENNADKSFIYYDVNEEGEKWWKDAANRIQRYHFTDFNFPGKSRLEALINRFAPLRKFPLPIKLYGGSKSSWWSINHESATYLRDFLQQDITLSNFLKYCWGTDEFVIPSLLLNSPLKDNIVNDNLRFIDFPAGKANPRFLEPKDVESIIKSTMLFARKFDIDVNVEALDRIDTELDQ